MKIKIKLKKKAPDGIPYIESQLIYAGKLYVVDDEIPPTQKQLEHFKDSIVIVETDDKKTDEPDINDSTDPGKSKKGKKSKSKDSLEPVSDANDEVIIETDGIENGTELDATFPPNEESL